MIASTVCVLLLMIISAAVCLMQYANGKKNRSLMWGLIVAYWFVLTIKNLIDWIRLI